MRFFVPSANDLREAEEIYCKIRDRVLNSNGTITDKRIYRLKYQHQEGPETVAVGSDRHRFGSDPVVAIFESSDGKYFICTQRDASSDVEPHALHSSAVVEAESFSALA